jgi:YhcH/YjgK/YiaL family protein
MIVDALGQAGRYRGISLLLDRGLEAAARLSANPPADGRIELAGSRLTAGLSTYDTEEPGSKLFEAHRRFIDIQVVLSGRETLYWAPLSALTGRVDYDEGKDISFHDGPAGLAVPLSPGWFTVLFPDDGHKPGCMAPGAGPARVRKLVIKVAV